MECLLPYLSMVTVPHIMVGLERMLDYRGVGLERFHCIYFKFSCEGSNWYVYFLQLGGSRDGPSNSDWMKTTKSNSPVLVDHLW